MGDCGWPRDFPSWRAGDTGKISGPDNSTNPRLNSRRAHPAQRRFALDKESILIAQIQKFLGGRIMARANVIYVRHAKKVPRLFSNLPASGCGRATGQPRAGTRRAASPARR